MEQRGVNIATAAANGDFIAVQLSNKTEPFMVGQVQGNSYRTLATELQCWLGVVPAGSEVIDVKVHEPITPGSNHIQACQDSDGKIVITPVLVRDIRLGPQKDRHTGQVSGNLNLKEVDMRASRHVEAGYKRYSISTELKQSILSSLVRSNDLVAERVGQLQSSEDSSVAAAWACKHCTFVNVTARSRCGACSKSRVA